MSGAGVMVLPLPWVYDDGGRAEAGCKGEARDCVCRAITIATGLPYTDVYQSLLLRARTRRATKRTPYRTPRHGVFPTVFKPYLTALGWHWTPTMHIGEGCTVHLREGELPEGRLIV